MVNKKDTIQLSASSVKMIYDASHNWANKMMGFKPEDHDYYHQGNHAQDLMNEHLSGRTFNSNLADLKEKVDGKEMPLRFPILEERDFDPRCKFTFWIRSMSSTQESLFSKQLEVGHGFTSPDIRGEYEIRGYVDGHDPVKGRILEVKSSSEMWTLGKFQGLMQRKVYALGFPSYKEYIGLTCLRDPLKWEVLKPKAYRLQLTQEDRHEAFEWILGAIKIIESGDWNGGLDENGKCTNPRCYYGVNCQFK